MRPEDLPLVGRVLQYGPDDSVYDLLILLGPVVLAVSRVAGRSTATEVLAAAYVLAFVGYLGYRAWTGDAA